MAILTGSQIVLMRDLGYVHIEPFDPSHVGPNSYDLTLAPELLVYDEAVLSMKRQNKVGRHIIPGKDADKGLILYPGQLYLGSTLEECGSDEFVCCIEGRSSAARLGISTHLSAGYGDLGYKYQWTLEITVQKPVEVFSGVRVCQAVFFDTRGKNDRLYRGKYSGQRGPKPSMMYKDFKEK